MKNLKLSNTAVLLVVALTMTLAFAAQRTFAADEGHFDRTLTVTGPVDLEVQTGSGDITVRAGNAGSVEIHAKIKANDWHFGSNSAQIEAIEKNPPIQQEGNTIRIGHVEDRELLRHISISYEIITPKETQAACTFTISAATFAPTQARATWMFRTFMAARESPPAAADSRPPALPARSPRQPAAATSSSNKRPQAT